jgi:ATP-dependent helicase HrpA
LTHPAHERPGAPRGQPQEPLQADPAGAARPEVQAPASLRLEYDPALPIAAHRGEILEALARHPVIVVCGATGSGKTTQLPKLCLEAGRGLGGRSGLIGHTQPRRIAARALAARLASELGTTVGGAVGYKVRFNERTGPECRLKLMTDGILLKELESDAALRRYDTLIIDEAHERSLNIDLLLGVIKRLVPRRPELRVIITSATIDPGKFAAFFDGAPVIEVSGRSYPVEVRYRPLMAEDEAEDEDAAELSLPEGIVKAVRELDGQLDNNSGAMRGDTLVFLPGEKHIREAADELQKAKLYNTEVLPLFARLSARDQERIFEAHATRRVLLATNVAETSLTVPGIRYVIDSGLARISRYSVRGKVQRLPIERISKASADQRKGRCGREAEGICIRLYSEEDFAQREDFTSPEVLRTNLASVILRMASIGLGEPESFPFIDPPDTRLVNDGVRLLQELKAMDEARRVTSLGHKIAALPVDPRLGRMLLAASHHNCLREMLAVAAFLETQDPRERPTDAQQQADEKHALFADPRSDFIAILNLWERFNERAGALSGNQLRKWCREHFLSFVRMREWQELHSQLSEAVRELQPGSSHPGARAVSQSGPASYADLHQAILTGFLGSVGRLDEKREYEGPRGIRFVIAPGTPLAAKPPKWVVAGSIVETTRVYARMVASINPQWIESAAAHLLKRTYTEPHWVEARGFVAAFETVTLYGLTLASRRRVNYGAIEPREARDIFIREHLINDEHTRVPAVLANRQLQVEVESLEAKIRRRDILVDEQAQVDFYSGRLPERVNTVLLFDRWRSDAERRDPQVLYMTRADLMRREAPDAGQDRFPDEWSVGANRLPLEYRFEPGEPADGITLIVPEPLLEMVNGEQLAWLVPGLRLEKITELFRGLPKAQRKLLVPVPEHARQALNAVDARSLPAFHGWLAGWVSQRIGAAVSAQELADVELPSYLRMNIRVVDADDRIIAEGRDVGALKRKVRSAPGAPSTDAVHREWDFGDLPASREVDRNRLRLIVYPAIEDRGSGVALVEARSAAAADALARTALVRLAMLGLPQQAKYLQKRFADNRELVLLSSGLALALPIAEALTRRAFRECFVAADALLPRTRAEFLDRLESRRAALTDVADELATIILAVLKELRAVRATLAALAPVPFADAIADITAQLQTMLPPAFIETTPRPWLDYLPRYLKAVSRRIERLAGNLARDAELAARVKPFAAALRALAAQPALAGTGEQLELLRWMIEELRVSLFAQELRTMLRVSEKRLAEQLELARREANG